MKRTASATCCTSILGSMTTVAGRLQSSGRGFPGHVHPGVADIDLATGNVMFPAIERDGSSEPGDRMFGGGVRRRIHPGNMGGDRAVVDNAAPSWLLRLHLADRLLGTQERAGKIHGDDLGPLFVAQIFHGNCGSIYAGVVKENIQPVELVAGSGKQGSDRAGLPNVGRDGKHGATTRSAMAAVRSSSVIRRPASTTEYPAECIVSATARPIPLPAPVTIATLPCPLPLPALSVFTVVLFFTIWHKSDSECSNVQFVLGR